MGDSGWTESDDAMLALSAIDDEHPVKLTAGVWNMLSQPEPDLELLRFIVTPESVDAWGDFSDAKAALDRPGLGLASAARRHTSAPDVAYTWLLANQTEAHLVRQSQAIPLALVFTWIWRPELGGWRLHQLGGPPLPDPDGLPRTSPTSAPDIGSVVPDTISG